MFIIMINMKQRVGKNNNKISTLIYLYETSPVRVRSMSDQNGATTAVLRPSLANVSNSAENSAGLSKVMLPSWLT